MNLINKKLDEMSKAGVPLSERMRAGQCYTEARLRGKTEQEAVAFAELTTKKRKALDDETFAIPEERKFPCPDRSHCANALARASGTKYESRVRAFVKKKYPDMGKEKD
jgi:hypothetical protein